MKVSHEEAWQRRMRKARRMSPKRGRKRKVDLSEGDGDSQKKWKMEEEEEVWLIFLKGEEISL